MNEGDNAQAMAKICEGAMTSARKRLESEGLRTQDHPQPVPQGGSMGNLRAFSEKEDLPWRRMDSKDRKRILIADDEEGIRFVLGQFLGRLEFLEIDTASSGLETGMKLSSFSPHLMILDHLLGDTTSKEVLLSARNDPAMRDLKIIVMSGYMTEEEVDRMIAEGVSDFIRKPFALEEVKAKVLLDLV
jgi:CheY-like chemotaxis protein